MGKYLNIGNDGFASVRKGLYVDKTGLISFINGTLGTADKLTCVSRPRRFGKSFAAKMLCAYYDKNCDSRELFEGLEISQDPSFKEYLNRYNVVYLDITEFTSAAFVKGEMHNIVKNLEKSVIEELSAACPEVEKQDNLPEMVYRIADRTKQKFIFIIDEWDALFRECKNDTLQQEAYIRLLRGLFKNSGITDKMIEAAYITGILPIKKYGTQSAMTDFREYTMLAPGKLARYVGFTETEAKQLCMEYGLDFLEAKRWYDGYSFQKVKSVYSPNSMTEAVKNEEFGNYWTQTETYQTLQFYIDLNEDGLKTSILQMLGGARIKIDAGTFQNDMTTMKSKDDVLTLLVHLGYLAYDAKARTVFIPNEEVRQEFVRAVTTGKHTEMAKLIRNSEHLLEATLNGDEEAVAAAMEEAHKAGTAPTFYNSEQALRSIIRLAYISCIEEYLKIEELPSGHGYADVVFFPKKTSVLPLLLIELKWDKTPEGAIGQIKKRDYPDSLKAYGGKILMVGINYDSKNKKHTCQIEEYRK